MSQTIFFSWQGDRSTKQGRNLIQKALERAVARIAEDMKVEEAIRNELVVDSDTKGVPGSPPIFQTILAKVDRASVFVGDLTICGARCDSRPTPNPNVLIEYGWALKSLGYFQVLTVMNEAHGEPHVKSMPFDLAHVRFPIAYNLPDDASDTTRRLEREKLAMKLEGALRGVFESEEFKAKTPEPPPFPRTDPINGKARFRAPQNPLGFVEDSLARFVGSPGAKAVYLAEGAARWLRLMPLHESGRK